MDMSGKKDESSRTNNKEESAGSMVQENLSQREYNDDDELKGLLTVHIVLRVRTMRRTNRRSEKWEETEVGRRRWGNLEEFGRSLYAKKEALLSMLTTKHP